MGRSKGKCSVGWGESFLQPNGRKKETGHPGTEDGHTHEPGRGKYFRFHVFTSAPQASHGEGVGLVRQTKQSHFTFDTFLHRVIHTHTPKHRNTLRPVKMANHDKQKRKTATATAVTTRSETSPTPPRSSPLSRPISAKGNGVRISFIFLHFLPKNARALPGGSFGGFDWKRNQNNNNSSTSLPPFLPFPTFRRAGYCAGVKE